MIWCYHLRIQLTEANYFTDTSSLYHISCSSVMVAAHFTTVKHFMLWGSGARFTNVFFAHNSNSMEIWPCHDSVAGHKIATNFCTCHNSIAVVPCTKFCSDHCIRIEVRVKRNFHQIWIAMEKPLVKRAPGHDLIGNQHILIAQECHETQHRAWKRDLSPLVAMVRQSRQGTQLNTPKPSYNTGNYILKYSQHTPHLRGLVMECFLWVHIWYMFPHLPLLYCMPHCHCIWYLGSNCTCFFDRGWIVRYLYFFNTLGPRKNCHHLADNIFKRITLNENVWYFTSDFT